MNAVPYSAELKDTWNDFVRSSKCGTFILEREYMDYHSDRFRDCSILIYDDRGKLKAVMPANWAEEERCVWSHQGLTYGGVLVDTSASQSDVLAIFEAMKDYYRDVLKATGIVYKPIPYIYSNVPSDEDLYALFRSDATLQSRLCATVLNMSCPLRMQTLRRRKATLARNSHLTVSLMQKEDWPLLQQFWDVLTLVLQERHHARPVHTFEEMQLLMTRFPDQIKLYVARHGQKVVAGTVVYETKHVVRVQYIASDGDGRQLGALDLLFEHLLKEVYRDVGYFDFGTSNEEGGRVLNEGLNFQKEGFGGRTVCYDTYRISLN